MGDARWLLANGLLVGGLGMMALSGETDTRPLMSSAVEPLAELEASAAREPNAEHVRELASAYIARDQPGLASAILKRSPENVQADPSVMLIASQAELAQGNARGALIQLEALEERCASGDCPRWVTAKGKMVHSFVNELVDSGIQDPAEDPAETTAAFRRSYRSGQLAMR